MDDIPILYAYIYRNIKKNNSNIINIETARICLRTIIVKCPRGFYRDIFDECVTMGLLKRIKRDNYKILDNRNIRLKVKKKLKEHIFPLSF